MRKRLLLIGIALAMPLVCAAGEDKETAKPPKKQGRITLPAGAEKLDSLTHRHRSSDGKIWIYRQTPFGLVRYEETEGVGRAAAPGKAEVGAEPELKAFDAGEQVRFEKKGPFGKYTWLRKKAELTDEERQAWERARQPRESAASQ